MDLALTSGRHRPILPTELESRAQPVTLEQYLGNSGGYAEPGSPLRECLDLYVNTDECTNSMLLSDVTPVGANTSYDDTSYDYGELSKTWW